LKGLGKSYIAVQELNNSVLPVGDSSLHSENTNIY